MKNFKRLLWLSAFVLAGYLLNQNWWFKDYAIQIGYDLQHKNNNIEEKQEVDKILSELHLVEFDDLDQEYLDNTLSSTPTFEKMLTGSSFYLVNKSDVNKKIVGNFRIKDFMSKDKYYKFLFEGKLKEIKWLINKKILYSVLDLQIELKTKGYDPNAFSIASGHRTPIRNRKIGGASQSRHIKGEALDIRIGDINRDGKYTAEDKEIVLLLVNEKIIAHQGGVGRYPGTRIVHIDVRGHHARWDSY